MKIYAFAILLVLCFMQSTSAKTTTSSTDWQTEAKLKSLSNIQTLIRKHLDPIHTYGREISSLRALRCLESATLQEETLALTSHKNIRNCVNTAADEEEASLCLDLEKTKADTNAQILAGQTLWCIGLP